MAITLTSPEHTEPGVPFSVTCAVSDAYPGDAVRIVLKKTLGPSSLEPLEDTRVADPDGACVATFEVLLAEAGDHVLYTDAKDPMGLLLGGAAAPVVVG